MVARKQLAAVESWEARRSPSLVTAFQEGVASLLQTANRGLEEMQNTVGLSVSQVACKLEECYGT